MKKLCSIIALILVYSFSFLTGSVQASHPLQPGRALLAPSLAVADLYLDVNMADGAVSGETAASDTVSLSLTDDVSVLKSTASTAADGAGFFSTVCSDWDGAECPDMVPGDYVIGTTTSGHSAEVQVGEILIEVDVSSDVIDGNIQAHWLSGTIGVQCNVWDGVTSDFLTTSANMDTDGSFTCSFSGIWDLMYGHGIEVVYFDGNHSVADRYHWPWMRVDYASDIVGGNYESGHTFWITVTESDESTIKGQAVVVSEPGVGWGGEDGFATSWWDWSSDVPDILPGDVVFFKSDDGVYDETIDTAIKVGQVDGTVNVGTDSVTGTINVPDTTGTLPVECHPWGAWGEGISSSVAEILYSSADAEGGTPHFDCDWSTTSYDLQPGQDVAVMYVETNLDRVINVSQDTAPHLQIEKSSLGEPGEGGNMSFRITYRNIGTESAIALITDTMVGLSYLSDTSGFSHAGSGAGPIIWDVGSIEPGEQGEFILFAQVTASETAAVSNVVEISTSHPQDLGEPGEKIHEWIGVVGANDTALHLEKYAWIYNPGPGQLFVWEVGACNFGSTSSGEVTLTDVIPISTSLDSWWSQDAGWWQVSLSGTEVVVSIPSLASHSCSELYFLFRVDPEAEVGEEISNIATLESADRPGQVSEAMSTVGVGYPQPNLAVEKSWSRGQLYPGGRIHYMIEISNVGNVLVEDLLLTDTLPADTALHSIELLDHFGTSMGDIAPSSTTESNFTVELDDIESGWSWYLDVTLGVLGEAVPGTTLTNTATLSCHPDEITCADNTSAVSEVLRSSGTNLRVGKTHEWVEDRSMLLYEITFENLGNEALAGVSLIDTYPVDTTFSGHWSYTFGEYVSLVDHTPGASRLEWEIEWIEPMAVGTIFFIVDLDDPTTPMQTFSNVVEVEAAPGEVELSDNYYEDVASNGGEVQSVHLHVATADSFIWGTAQSGSTVEVTTAHAQYYAAAEPSCGGCWSVENAGPVSPGDTITVGIVGGAHPVTIPVPDPFTAQGDSMAVSVAGQIDSLYEETVLATLYMGPSRSGPTDTAGHYTLTFPEYPQNGEGVVKYSTMINYAEIHYYIEFGDMLMVFLPLVIR